MVKELDHLILLNTHLVWVTHYAVSSVAYLHATRHSMMMLTVWFRVTYSTEKALHQCSACRLCSQQLQAQRTKSLVTSLM